MKLSRWTAVRNIVFAKRVYSYFFLRILPKIIMVNYSSSSCDCSWNSSWCSWWWWCCCCSCFWCFCWWYFRWSSDAYWPATNYAKNMKLCPIRLIPNA